MCLRVLIALGCGCVLASSQGCSHMVESRVIQAFADSLEQENLEGLRKTSSEGFDDRALQNKAAIDAFKVVGMPSGKTTVLKVVDKGEEKKVTVEVGEAKRKILYKLWRDPKSNQWVVDDIFLNPKPTPNNRSVGEQMSVLLCAHQFAEAWKSGERAQVLETATPAFASLLGNLPEAHLSNLTQQLAGEVREPKHIDISEETAEIHYAKLAGTLIVQFHKHEQTWKVEDVGFRGRRETDTIASVRHVAVVTATALAFEAAFNAEDKQKLQAVSTKRFFDGSLAPANLSLAKLPSGTEVSDNDVVNLDGQTATYVTHDNDDVIKFSMIRESSEEPSAIPVYRVEEVTIYETQGNQDKRLSALFTAHAVMQLFSEDLVARNLAQLKLNSTPDFNHRVWDRATESIVGRLPMAEIQPGQPEVINTIFQGPITQINVTQGNVPLTYVLRDHGGRIFVDDVLMPALDRPESLKTALDLMLPILHFADGFQASALDKLRGHASREFCRTVWNQIDRMPDVEQNPMGHLNAPLTKISLTPDRALVTLGDDRFGAKVFLVMERDRYVLDDVLLISGVETAQRQSLKRLLRDRLQNGRFVGSESPHEVSQTP